MTLPDGFSFDALSLPDLVQAKKTQRDKDWPMVRRLLEAHYFQNRDHPTTAHIRFWMLELRSPELLIQVAKDYRKLCERFARKRPLLHFALQADHEALEAALRDEESLERQADRSYWQPLRAELEEIRRTRSRNRRTQ